MDQQGPGAGFPKKVKTVWHGGLLRKDKNFVLILRFTNTFTGCYQCLIFSEHSSFFRDSEIVACAYKYMFKDQT